MRICQVLAGDEEGGLEKHFEELCNGLVAFHEVHVIAHERYRKSFGEKVTFHALDLSKGRRNLFLLYQLRQTINHIDPDIIHAHASKAVAMVANIKSFLNSSIKIIATLHSTKHNLKKFECYDHVIGVSHEVLKNLKNIHQSVVYNGIELTHIEKDSRYLSQFGIKDEFVICSVGRLESVKNFPLLIDAIKELNVKLIIVGEGSEKSKLQKLVKELFLEDKVVFAGFRKDVPEIIVNSDLCVITSDREGFSYVMAESLLLGVPLISTDVGDMKRILPSFYVVPVNDRKELKKTILYIQNNYLDVMKHYIKSFSYAREHFILDKMINNTLNVYKKVAEY